jgi:toxin-antitoxin system PIN domain toxin
LPNSTDLLDANVWLALAAEGHTHHQRARSYWESEAAPLTGFCRVTLLAFLRHLTNKSIMGEHVLSPAAAWKKRGEFLALPEVRLLSESPGLDESLAKYFNLGRTSPNLWTDAYLAAFAASAQLRLVTFDRRFSRFSGLELLLLECQESTASH